MNIEEVDKFAEECHRGQFRKYTNEPYIVHPRRVLSLYKRLESKRVSGISGSNRSICLLHDVIEDCDVTHSQLVNNFGYTVANGVMALTNRYTKKDFPDLNRGERSVLEAVRLSGINPGLQEIKVLDMIDNLTDFAQNDPSYFPKYLEEKKFCVQLMSIGDDVRDLFESTVKVLKFQIQPEHD